MLQGENRGTWRQKIEEGLERETGDGRRDSRRNRQKLRPVNALDGNLGCRIEGAEAFHLIAEEFGADWEFLSRRPGVKNAAAYGEIAFGLDQGDATIADFGEFFGYLP